MGGEQPRPAHAILPSMDALPPRTSWRVVKPTALPLRPDLDGLLEEGSDPLPVRITIVQDGITTGWDDGALGFEEEAVWFSGRACSFRVAAPDVLPCTYLPWGDEMETGPAHPKEMRLRHPTRKVLVNVELIGIGGKARHDAAQSLNVRINQLRAHKSGGMSQYPPLAPRDGLIPKSPTRKQSIVFLLTLLAGSAVLIVWKPSVFPIAGALFGVADLVYNWRTNGYQRSTLQRIASEEEGSGDGSPWSRGEQPVGSGQPAPRAQGGTVGEGVPRGASLPNSPPRSEEPP